MSTSTQLRLIPRQSETSHYCNEKEMVLNFHSNLLKDFSSMLTDTNGHDVIIKVGDNQNMKEFTAHSNILKVRSAYFKSGLSADWAIKKDNFVEFTKPDINPAVFEIILRYIYTGEVDIAKLSSANIFELLIASDELLFEELFEGVQDYLINYQTNWIELNFVLVLHTVFKLPSCKKLLNHCIESICVETFTSKNFLSLDKEVLYELLKRDDLQIEEIFIWDYLIEWGINNTPSLINENDDKIKWNNENYEALKETLSEFIPLIRFSEINSADFFDKVLPFKDIISNNIYDAMIKYYLKGILPEANLAPRLGEVQIDSNIIKPKLAYIITNWINRKNARAIRNREEPKYFFELLYRSSRDGLNRDAFHAKCQNQFPYFVLIQEPKKTLNIWRKNLQKRNDDDTGGWDSISGPTSNSYRPNWNLDEDNLPWAVPNNPQQTNLNTNDSWGNIPETPQPRQTNWDTPRKTCSKKSKIYGEYNTDLSSSYDTFQSFIFSFANDNDTKNMKISHPNHNHVSNLHGGSFNSYYLSNTFYIDCGSVCALKSNYCDNNIVEQGMRFDPGEIEVFKVTKIE